MIGDDDVNGVGGPAPRHVASGAVFRFRMPLIRRPRCRCAVAAKADLGVMPDSLSITQSLVWIVAGGARQCADAGKKTAGLAQAVGRTDQLELIVVTRGGRM